MTQSKTTIVRQNKEDNLLKSFNNISYLILKFRSNHKWMDGRELKKVSLITTGMADKVRKYSSEVENDNTAADGEHPTPTKPKLLKKVIR